MGPEALLFLYLPLPYWAASVLLEYRHGLSRMLHPARDNGSLRNWWSVLSHLGLLDLETVRPGRKAELLPYAVYLSASMALSLSWVLRIFPPLWYYLLLVQGISGLVLTTATVQYLGPPPRRPYVDVLGYPRRGSRIMHLRDVPSPSFFQRMSKTAADMQTLAKALQSKGIVSANLVFQKLFRNPAPKKRLGKFCRSIIRRFRKVVKLAHDKIRYIVKVRERKRNASSLRKESQQPEQQPAPVIGDQNRSGADPGEGAK